jgi:hypothetical protein
MESEFGHRTKQADGAHTTSKRVHISVNGFDRQREKRGEQERKKEKKGSTRRSYMSHTAIKDG